MKNLLVILAFILSLSLQAQNNDSKHEERMENLKAQKIAFITSEINLTPSEAQLFWPLYNEYSEKRQAFYHERINISKKVRDSKTNLIDKEANEMSEKWIKIQKQEANLEEEYYSKFKNALPATKLLKFYVVEMQFKQKLLKQLKHNRDGNREIDSQK